MSISTILLAYKEAENLKILLPQIKENLDKCNEKYEILVIDTIEPLDNTKDICLEHGVKYINQEEPYFAGAFRTGIKYASMDKFLIMDSDGSHDPKYISEVNNVFLSGADVAIGSRYIKGGFTNDSITSRIMSFFLNTAFRIVLGIKAKDISTDYRMYHTADLKNVNLSCNNYDVLQEVLLKIKLNKGKIIIKETPIVFNKRLMGESKRRLLPFIMSYIKTLCSLTFIRAQYFLKNERGRRILKQFILYGLIGCIGAIIDFSVFYILNRWQYGFNPVINNIIASFIGFSFTFSFNTFFNFKKSDKLVRRFLSYLIICICGMFISSVIIYFLQYSVNLSLLKGTCITFVACLQFLLNKLITFRF